MLHNTKRIINAKQPAEVPLEKTEVADVPEERNEKIITTDSAFVIREPKPKVKIRKRKDAE